MTITSKLALLNGFGSFGVRNPIRVTQITILFFFFLINSLNKILQSLHYY